MGSIGTTEILIIAAILVFLFGARKLPDMARGIGQSLRVFKAEVTQPDEPARAVNAAPDPAAGKPAEPARAATES